MAEVSHNYITTQKTPVVQKQNVLQVPPEQSSAQPAASVTSQKDCGKDIDCLILAAKTCEPARVEHSLTVNVFGNILTIKNLLTISPSQNGICTTVGRPQDLQGTSVPAEVKKAYLETTITCSYSNSDLVQMLTELKKGNSSSLSNTNNCKSQNKDGSDTSQLREIYVSNPPPPVTPPATKISTVNISREISDKENWFVYRFTATCHGSSFDDPACKNLPSFEMKYPKHFDEALNQISGMSVQTKHNLTLGEGDSYKTQFEACNKEWENI